MDNGQQRREKLGAPSGSPPQDRSVTSPADSKLGASLPRSLLLRGAQCQLEDGEASNSDKGQTQREARRLSQGVGAHTRVRMETGSKGPMQALDADGGHQERVRAEEGPGETLPPDTSADSLSTGMETRMGLHERITRAGRRGADWGRASPTLRDSPGAGLLKERVATRTQREPQEALAGQLVLMNRARGSPC